MYECKILKDSVNSVGNRLTSFQVTFPRFILAEANTHRMLSRNSASSRAIPIAKSLEMLRKDPFVPNEFPSNQKGMVGGDVLTGDGAAASEVAWMTALEHAMEASDTLNQLGVHKGWGNRLLEPFKWHTAIITATDWSNFFALRNHPEAQPEFQTIAAKMQAAYDESIPALVFPGEWSLPYVDEAEIHGDANYPLVDWPMWVNVSTGRCARVSYLTQEGKRDLQADIELATTRLAPKGHVSPFEHPARPFTPDEWSAIHNVQDYIRGVMGKFLDVSAIERMCTQLEYRGNLHGWHSARYDIPNQDDFSKVIS